MKTIEFNLEIARQITNGNKEGKIVTSNGCDARIVCFDKLSCDKGLTIIALIDRGVTEEIRVYNNEGVHAGNVNFNLLIEIPVDFNPFDRVLVRVEDNCTWQCGLYSHKHDNQHVVNGELYPICIPYEGNEHLAGTTKSPDHERNN